MKGKILMLLNVLVLLFVSASLIYNSYIAEEPNYRTTSKGAVFLISYLLAIIGASRRRSEVQYKVYEESYKAFIEGAFSEDEKSYKELLQVLIHCNHKQYKKAQKLLDKLQEKCMYVKDYAAVYLIKAVCLESQNKTEQAIAVYEKLLQKDISNSCAWSNVGTLYSKKRRRKEAIEAYSNAILYDSNNDYAYNNRAQEYLGTGEIKLALEDALKALEINPQLHPAMATAAAAYKLLGDDANAEKFSKMHDTNGGNPKDMETIMTYISSERKDA